MISPTAVIDIKGSVSTESQQLLSLNQSKDFPFTPSRPTFGHTPNSFHSTTMLLLTCGALVLMSFAFLSFHRVSALSTIGSKQLMVPPESSTSDDITLSLWLMPPQPAREKIAAQISALANNGTRGPLFAPHITVVGAFRCKTEEEVQEVANRLRHGLAGFGEIPCGTSAVAYAGRGAWNQALYVTVEMSAPLMNLCQKSRAILGLDTDNWTFPAPATYPHMSMFYGVNDVPDKTEVRTVKPFYSHEIALWRTDPPSLEGVANWKEVATFTTL